MRILGEGSRFETDPRADQRDQAQQIVAGDDPGDAFVDTYDGSVGSETERLALPTANTNTNHLSAPKVGVGRMSLPWRIALATGANNGFHSHIPRRYLRHLSTIHGLRTEMLSLSRKQIQERFLALRLRRQDGAELDDLLPEVFALVREASRRTLGMEHYEEQLLAGMALANGKVAQLGTGAGKTVVAALAATLLALDGHGVHVATANDYLAQRGAEWLKPLYESLGLSVGVTKSFGQTRDEKRPAYAADVTYGYSDTFVFDWLDDQLVWDMGMRIQRGLSAVIVDEIDDILVDAATEPRVLCGLPEEMSEMEDRATLIEAAWEIVDAIDSEQHVDLHFEGGQPVAALTEAGLVFLERRLIDYVARHSEDERSAAAQYEMDPEMVWSEAITPLFHYVRKALEAQHSIALDEDYIHSNEGVLLVNSTNGHLQRGARLRHGLMDVVLFKEHERIERELKSVGQIPFQSFFLMYGHTCGMTGTARSCTEELGSVYGLGVIEIPEHNNVIRKDLPDRFFANAALGLLAAGIDAKERSGRGQPVLIATTSVLESKLVSARLKDPVHMLFDVAISSPRLLEAAITGITGGEALLEELRAPPHSGAGRKRAAILKDILELLRGDPAGLLRFAHFLKRNGFDAPCLLGPSGAAPPITHRLLNAETEDREARIIARAGEYAVVTVATQMAGRGVDIPLAEGVADLGGLHVIGIGHQPNRRKDAQLRGRAGRQGQPGSSQFYVSPSDEFLDHLPADRLRGLSRLSRRDVGEFSGALRHLWEEAVIAAQDQAETGPAYVRMRSSEFDRVVHRQRTSMVSWRDELLESNAVPEMFNALLHEELDRGLLAELSGDPDAYHPDPDRNLRRIEEHRRRGSRVDQGVLAPLLSEILPEGTPLELADTKESIDKIRMRLNAAIADRIRAVKEHEGGGDTAFNQYARNIALYHLDEAWRGHIELQDELRRGAILQGYRNRDPFISFVKESSEAFQEMGEDVRRTIADRWKYHLAHSAP